MYKKYIANGSFRNLVRPVLASEIDIERSESFDLSSGMIVEQNKKKCCN